MNESVLDQSSLKLAVSHQFLWWSIGILHHIPYPFGHVLNRSNNQDVGITIEKIKQERDDDTDETQPCHVEKTLLFMVVFVICNRNNKF